ncbi:MAG: hypothetical protein RML12_04990 [Xanthomonadales bacterium]|nr:hypothetical protein [Xanthomonadales bacterium]
MDPRLLEILRCPATRQPLRLASSGELAALNRMLAEGRAVPATGGGPASTLAAALLTADGQRAYRIEDGIPVLLPEEAIVLREPLAR